jgi:hypothetical protein
LVSHGVIEGDHADIVRSLKITRGQGFVGARVRIEAA